MTIPVSHSSIAEHLRLYDASFRSLPLNPLIPAIDKRKNLINPSQHTYQVTDIIKRIYKLGDQQAFRLREAMKRAYQLAGIPLKPGTLPAGKSFPQLDLVQHDLSGDKANEPLLGRLSPIFDLGLFAGEVDQSDFEDFFEGSMVIRLGQLPSDEVKNSVAEFFLMALYNHLIRQPANPPLQPSTRSRRSVAGRGVALPRTPYARRSCVRPRCLSRQPISSRLARGCSWIHRHPPIFQPGPSRAGP